MVELKEEVSEEAAKFQTRDHMTSIIDGHLSFEVDIHNARLDVRIHLFRSIHSF